MKNLKPKQENQTLKTLPSPKKNPLQNPKPWMLKIKAKTKKLKP
jgi:hypothetical protein